MWGTQKKNKKRNVKKFSFSFKKKTNTKTKKCKCKDKSKKNTRGTKKGKGKKGKMKKKKIKTKVQRGKGKYLTAVPSEYYNTKNRISYVLDDGLSKFQGNVRPIDPNPTYQNYQVSKFDIGPPTSLLEK